MPKLLNSLVSAKWQKIFHLYTKTFSKFDGMIYLRENLKELRLSHRLTQNKIASTLNKKVKAYSAWEYGNGAPSLDELIRIAQYYGIAIHRLCFKKV